MYEDKIAMFSCWNEASGWFRIKSGVKQGYVLSPFVWIIRMDFDREHSIGNERTRK